MESCMDNSARSYVPGSSMMDAKYSGSGSGGGRTQQPSKIIPRARASSAGKRSGFGRTFAICEGDPRKTSSAMTKAV
jgi:hypothetical protein